jgi:hypothetical protein
MMSVKATDYKSRVLGADVLRHDTLLSLCATSGVPALCAERFGLMLATPGGGGGGGVRRLSCSVGSHACMQEVKSGS